MRLFSLLFIFLIYTPGFLKAQSLCQSQRYIQPVFNQVKITSDIKYGTADPYGIVDNQDLFIDVYEPQGDTLSNRPVIVYAYGGAFLIGVKNQPPIPYYADYFVKLGYVFVSMQYRLGFNVTLPGSPERAVYRAVQDQRAAIRFLAQRAGQFRIDTSRFILMGSSAGCFAGLHSTYMEYADAVPFSTPIPVLDGELLGGIDSSGNNDFGNRYVEPFAIINQWGALADTNWIDADERYPVISFHGDQDDLVPYNSGYPFSYPVFPNVFGSNPIHRRLDHLGIHNQLVTLAGYGHEPELLDLALRDTILNYSRLFMYPLLQPQTSNINGPIVTCTNTEVTYSVVNTPGSRYCWSWDGNPVVVSNNGHTITLSWLQQGVYGVRVKEINKNGAEGVEKLTTTRVLPKVDAWFGQQVNELDVNFVNFSLNATTYDWSFGDGATSNSDNPQHSYNSGGTYTIHLIADNGVCPDTFQTVITIDSCPVANFNATITMLNGVFNANITNTTTYQWDFGDGQQLQSTSPNVLHIYQQPDVYTVTLSVKNTLDCESVYTTQITVGSPSGIVNTEQAFQLAESSNSIHITGERGKKFNISVFNFAGQLIQTQVADGAVVIDKLNMPKGRYLLLLRNSGAVQYKAFSVLD